MLQFLCFPGANLLKLYLGRILDVYDEKEGSDPQPGHQQKFRYLIGEVLMQTENLGDPQPYMPFFYHTILPDLRGGFAEVISISTHCTLVLSSVLSESTHATSSVPPIFSNCDGEPVV